MAEVVDTSCETKGTSCKQKDTSCKTRGRLLLLGPDRTNKQRKETTCSSRHCCSHPPSRSFLVHLDTPSYPTSLQVSTRLGKLLSSILGGWTGTFAREEYQYIIASTEQTCTEYGNGAHGSWEPLNPDAHHSKRGGMPLTCQINILFNRKWSSHVPTF